MDSQTPEGIPQPASQPVPAVAVGYPPPQPPAKKRMSAGAKWAIGLGIAFVVLTIVSCCGSIWLLGSETGSSAFSLGDSVCVIHLEGVIQGGGTGSASPEYILDQLDQALADDSVKAILLRIDSPGGTVAASQEISLAVKRASEQKPVVVSVGDICASGGYMVASQADEIIASPGSSVGSIGVIMEIANVEGLLDKIGVDFITLHEGAYKDAGSPYRPVTEEEIAMLNEQLKIVYDQFIKDVAEGRDMSESDVRELATGWVWLGSEALDLGLIDSLGNYDDAVDRAAELGGIEGEPAIVSYEYVDPLSGLYESLGIKSPADAIDADTLRRIALPR
ncbi:MAG: signal peptide peptidase SppA [Actinobacteria bacterium]|nr:signal peptide peptidase SppA [Actinomycetota bacterium]